jgi:hypothetical protein
LSDAERDAAIADLSEGIDWSKARKLHSNERRQWQHTKRALGRPKVGLGCKSIAVTLERGLLNQVDRYVKKHDLKRSQLIATSLRLVLAQQAVVPGLRKRA